MDQSSSSSSSSAASSAPQRMFEMITGYWVTQVVATVAALGIVDVLDAAGEHRVEGLARKLEVDPGALARLLRAGATVGLFTRAADSTWHTTELSKTLGAKHPGTMRGMAIAQASPGHWLPWCHLTDAIRTGERQTLKTHGGKEIFEYYADPKNKAEALAFNEAMHGLSSLAARELAACLEIKEGARIVDVGGAQGTLLRTLLTKWPSATGVLLDLPHIATAMTTQVKDWAEGPRVEVAGGNFFESVPGGDIFVLKQILHDWSDEQCTTILRNCVKSMRPKGRIVIVESIIPDDGRPSPATLMDLNMLVLLPGRERTLTEFTNLFASAGLVIERVSQTHSPFEIIEAIVG